MATRPAYSPPVWFTSHVVNPAVAALTRSGVSVLGSRVLRIRGRTSGLWRETPVNLLTLRGQNYLVAARGQTQWVRNLRASREGELRVGSTRQTFTAEELPDLEKTAVLRAYLRKWRWEVGAFFAAIGPDASQSDLLKEARHHPVFRLRIAAEGEV